MSTTRNVFETVIMGEEVRLSADVGEERMRKISEYIEQKSREIQKVKRGLPITTPLFKLLVNVNIADDVFTAREQAAKLKTRVTALEKELAKARQELKDYEELFENQS